MIFIGCITIALALTGTAFSANVQNPHIFLPPSAAANQAAVEKIFTESYAAYKKFAFGHDDLSPLSQSFSDGRNGWGTNPGASIVDAMSTMHIMGLDDLFEEAVNFSSHIDFSISQTPDTVSVFETTIRYLGGLLSSYELSGQKFPALLEKAKEVADKLAFAWVGSNDIPFGFLDFSTNTPTIDTSNIAEAGTLTLEFSTLTKHTGNQTYADLVLKSVTHIANLPAPLPGLAAQGIDPASGQFVGGYVTWGGGSDSYFEYLIKFARLSNTDNNLFADTWHTAVDSSIKNMLRDRIWNVSWAGTGCWFGIIGGRLLNNVTIVEIALGLIDGCWNTYASDATGIGPEVFAYISSDGNFTGGDPPTADQLAFFNEHGYYITVADYILRPEVLESNFYAYRVTGDSKYLDRAASAVNSFNKFLQTPTGFAGLFDVNNVKSDKVDDTESFWFAEVLKYLYLTFDDPNHISLDEWVFNTEAHPFQAPPAKPFYGSTSGSIRPPIGPFKFQTGPSLPLISPGVGVPKIITPQ
ncbi:glycoside hydrolase family 47 protein [Phlegmacium glaucopus]|nr:glycoside hydrolase family 47 protein [Phlegmacium glaucopus]